MHILDQDPTFSTVLARDHIEELQREAARERLAREVQKSRRDTARTYAAGMFSTPVVTGLLRELTARSRRVARSAH